jgi:hypothetical protein
MFMRGVYLGRSDIGCLPLEENDVMATKRHENARKLILE